MSLGSCAGGELSVQGGPALRTRREATGVKVLGQQGFGVSRRRERWWEMG